MKSGKGWIKFLKGLIYFLFTLSSWGVASAFYERERERQVILNINGGKIPHALGFGSAITMWMVRMPTLILFIPAIVCIAKSKKLNKLWKIVFCILCLLPLIMVAIWSPLDTGGG